MVRMIANIEVETGADSSRLVRDYLRDSARGIAPWLPGIPADWKAVEPVGRAAGSSTWDAVATEVRASSRRLGSSAETLEKLRGAARFVVTGQQPGTLGGPLLTIYKVATAAAVADYLERTLGHPFVPLYWCGSDDTDFQEIRSFGGLSHDVQPFESSMAASAHTAGKPVGDIGLEWPRRVWEAVLPLVDGFEHGGDVKEAVSRAFESAGDHGELAAAILIALTGGRLAVVDGRSGSVRRHAQDLLVRYISDEAQIKRMISDEGERLEAAGYHAQLSVGPDSGVFLLEQGIRKTVAPDRHSHLLEEARRRVENCSPGVAVRNLIQDYVFEPAAVVLGPAEIAYRAQIFRLYDYFDIARPVSIPRMTATYLPPPVAALLDEDGLPGAEMMIANPQNYVRYAYERAVPAEAAEAAGELSAALNTAIERFSGAVGPMIAGKAFRKLRSRLGELRKYAADVGAAVEDVGKSAALDRWPFLSHLGAVVRPGEKPQERSMSALVPFLFAGAAVVDDFAAVAATYTDDLLDGRARHIVYSSK